jgi:hypothetical protein
MALGGKHHTKHVIGQTLGPEIQYCISWLLQSFQSEISNQPSPALSHRSVSGPELELFVCMIPEEASKLSASILTGSESFLACIATIFSYPISRP